VEENISELQNKNSKLSENIISGNQPFTGLSGENVLDLFN
jgi:SNF2 family DNA or RNA helicase